MIWRFWNGQLERVVAVHDPFFPSTIGTIAQCRPIDQCLDISVSRQIRQQAILHVSDLLLNRAQFGPADPYGG
jgi:hypothetical protein